MQEPADTKTAGAATSPIPQFVGERPDEASSPGEAEPDRIRSAHLRFKLTGTPPETAESIEGLVPIQLYPLLKSGAVRGDYPVVIPVEGRPSSLTSLIDRALENLDVDDDERGRSRTAAFRLEAQMRRIVDSEGACDLEGLWDSAVKAFEKNLDNEQREEVLERLARIREQIHDDANVVPFGRDAAVEMFKQTAANQATQRVQELKAELDDLRLRLEAMIALDDSDAPEAHTPETLAASVGGAFGNDFDFEALSELMDHGPHGPSLDDERRSRIESTLEILSDYAASLGELAKGRQKVAVVSNPDEILTLGARHRERSLQLVKAAQSARLEAAGAYKDRGPQLDALTRGRLTRDDLASLPADPVVVPQHLASFSEHVLQTVLDGDDPVKVLVLAGAIGDEFVGVNANTPLGLRLLAGGRPSSALFQVDLSDVETVVDAFERALAYPGAAVVCLHVGAMEGPDGVDPSILSAAARDARVFPYFANDPSGGSAWADRFSVDRNVDDQSAWPSASVRYHDLQGNEVAENQPFTPVHFLSMSERASAEFRQIPPDEWHDDLIPLDQYLALKRRDETVPYILLVSDTGELCRAICTDRIVRTTERVALSWRALQELAGVDNSHASRLVEEERRRLKEEADARIAQVEAEFQDQLDKKTGILAEQIVSNIAAGLLGSDLTAVPIQPSETERIKQDSQAGSTEDPQTETQPESAEPDETAEAAEAVEEDDDLSFDEAYIETPRCTTCDECTAINPRMFAYNSEKQAYIADINAGTFRELVLAAEKCPVKIIHPGKPINNDEPHLDELIARAEAFQ